MSGICISEQSIRNASIVGKMPSGRPKPRWIVPIHIDAPELLPENWKLTAQDKQTDSGIYSSTWISKPKEKKTKYIMFKKILL